MFVAPSPCLLYTSMEMLEEAKAEISAEDFMRAEYVIEDGRNVISIYNNVTKQFREEMIG